MRPVRERSVTAALAGLDPKSVGPILSELTPEQRMLFQADWSVFAHPAQRNPPGDLTTWLLLGGRGSGKWFGWIRTRRRRSCWNLSSM